MVDNQLIDQIMTLIAEYGLWIMGIDLLLAAAALPLPATPMVIAVGALARQGLFNWPAAFAWSLFGIVVGDTISYGLGRFAGSWSDRHIGQRFGSAWVNAQAQFTRYGSWAIFLSRWLFNSLDVPTNLIAGASRYDFKRFMIYVLSGRTIWLILYGGIGYAISSHYRLIVGFVARYTIWIGLLVMFILGTYIVIRRIIRSKRIEPGSPAPGPVDPETINGSDSPGGTV
jgi:membrane protein DedA with SNARE-associated domain